MATCYGDAYNFFAFYFWLLESSAISWTYFLKLSLVEWNFRLNIIFYVRIPLMYIMYSYLFILKVIYSKKNRNTNLKSFTVSSTKISRIIIYIQHVGYFVIIKYS